MRRSLATIGHLAEQVGFRAPDLHTATALAYVASGGFDHFDLPVGIPGAGRYVGLWGVDVDEWTEYTVGDLHDPYRAAEVAYALTRRCDGFGWSAHWRAGAERPHVDAAIAARTLTPYAEPQHVPIVAHVYRHRTDQHRAARARRTVEAHQWQIPTR